MVNTIHTTPEPLKIEPGTDMHLTLLMAPDSLNLVVGEDRAALLRYAKRVWQAAQSQPAPPVPASVQETGCISNMAISDTQADLSLTAVPQTVQEIMRLMNPYVRACAGFDASIDELDDAKAEITEAFKPLEAALTALVEKNHRLKFELDGVRSMRGPEWQPIETAPKDGTDILLYAGPQTFEGKPVPERNTSGYWLKEEGYIREHRDLDGRWIGQDESDGYEGWLSWDGGFTEENPPTHWMPRPAPPTSTKENAS